jgi:polysaccharide pyruvyl transferase WcaK-like protein
VVKRNSVINSITLLGSSSGRNAGDAALIAGIIDSVDAAVGRKVIWEIPTIKPSYIRDNYRGITRPISMLPWAGSVKMLGIPTYRSIHRTDMSLIFDAILFDRALYNPLFNYLSTVSLLLPAAKRKGKLLGYFNVGVGPITTPAGSKMLQKLSDEMDFITVRDQDSYRILQEIGVKNPNILVTADAALNMAGSSEERVDEILGSIGFNRSEQILAINLSKYIDTWAGAGTTPMGKERFAKTYAAALDRALERIQAPVLFVCTQVHDVPLTKMVMELVTKAPKKGIITNERYNHYDIKGVLGAVSLLCGMRLHATILASASLTPVLGLPHQPKVIHYFRTIDLEDRIITFKDFTEESFGEFIVKGWEQRAKIRATLERKVPQNKQRALRAAELVAALDRGEAVDTAIRGLSSAA